MRRLRLRCPLKDESGVLLSIDLIMLSAEGEPANWRSNWRRRWREPRREWWACLSDLRANDGSEL